MFDIEFFCTINLDYCEGDMPKLNLNSINFNNLSKIEVTSASKDRPYGRRFKVKLEDGSHQEVVFSDLFKKALDLLNKANTIDKRTDLQNFLYKLDRVENAAKDEYEKRSGLYKFRTFFHRLFGGAFLGSHSERLEYIINIVDRAQMNSLYFYRDNLFLYLKYLESKTKSKFELTNSRSLNICINEFETCDKSFFSHIQNCLELFNGQVTISIDNLSRLDKEALQQLTQKHGALIRRLSLNDMDDLLIKEVITACPALRELSICASQTTKIIDLQSLKNLEVLKLEDFNDSNFPSLPSQFIKIDLKDCPQLNDEIRFTLLSSIFDPMVFMEGLACIPGLHIKNKEKVSEFLADKFKERQNYLKYQPLELLRLSAEILSHNFNNSLDFYALNSNALTLVFNSNFRTGLDCLKKFTFVNKIVWLQSTFQQKFNDQTTQKEVLQELATIILSMPSHYIARDVRSNVLTVLWRDSFQEGIAQVNDLNEVIRRNWICFAFSERLKDPSTSPEEKYALATSVLNLSSALGAIDDKIQLEALSIILDQDFFSGLQIAARVAKKYASAVGLMLGSAFETKMAHQELTYDELMNLADILSEYNQPGYTTVKLAVWWAIVEHNQDGLAQLEALHLIYSDSASRALNYPLIISTVEQKITNPETTLYDLLELTEYMEFTENMNLPEGHSKVVSSLILALQERLPSSEVSYDKLLHPIRVINNSYLLQESIVVLTLMNVIEEKLINTEMSLKHLIKLNAVIKTLKHPSKVDLLYSLELVISSRVEQKIADPEMMLDELIELLPAITVYSLNYPYRELMFATLIIPKLQAVMSDPEIDAEKLLELANICNDSPLLPGDHPLREKAELIIRASQERGAKNPFTIYKKLKKLLLSESTFIPPTMLVEGIDVRINMGQLESMSQGMTIKRADLSKLVTLESFDKLFKDLANKVNRNRRAADLALDQLDTNWKTIQTPISNDPLNYLRGLLTLQGENVSEVEAKWRAMLQNILETNNRDQPDQFFTEQEEVFILTMMGIQRCQGGKEGGIASSYELLEPRYRYPVKLSKPMSAMEAVTEDKKRKGIEFIQEFLKTHTSGNLVEKLVEYVNEKVLENSVNLVPFIEDDKYWDTDTYELNSAGALELLKIEKRESAKNLFSQVVAQTIQKLMGDQFSGVDSIMKELIGKNTVNQGVHQAIYLKNLIGHLVGVTQKTITFDIHTGTLYENLIRHSRHDVLAVFFKHITPDVMVNEIVRTLNASNAETKKTLKAILSDDKYWEDAETLNKQGALELLLELNYLST